MICESCVEQIHQETGMSKDYVRALIVIDVPVSEIENHVKENHF